MQSVAIHYFLQWVIILMNCAENYKSQQSSSIYNPSHHIIQAPKVLGAREILVQFWNLDIKP